VTFLKLYRASFYLMLVLATLLLDIDAAENRLAMLFPLAVAAAGFVAFTTVDRNPRLGLSRGLANCLALASIGLTYLEYKADPTQTLFALAHWLVYLQLIKMFLPKTVEDDWFLFLLGLMQVLVGAVLSQSDQVGFLLLAWALAALWVLGLFSLHRDALRSRASASSPSTAPTATPESPYPGLIDLPFVLSSLRIALLTLALGGIIFLAMPRYTNMGQAAGGQTVAKHLTGFDDEVQLGQLGEILENDTVVMSVELYDENDRRIEPQGEMLWRGVTLADYDQRRWHRQDREPQTFPILSKDLGTTLRQQIKLEANDSSVLFGLRPMLGARSTSGRFGPDLNKIDGTIFRTIARPGPYDYEVLSDADPAGIQPGEAVPVLDEVRRVLNLPAALKDRLRRIAEPIVAGIPPADSTARARALEEFLRDSGQFHYTLQMNVVDPSLDPVEDFLVNRKEGHCEYFASALALMLRSIGIPTRMVNGFKGGDWNELARILSVRQKHAHSWVEALVGTHNKEASRHPLWITLDPTPATERSRSVAQVGGFTTHFRPFSDLVRYVWVFYVVGFNKERQERLLYEPLRQLILKIREGFQIMGQMARSAAARLLDFPSVRSLFSLRGFLVSFTALALMGGLIGLVVWLMRRVVRWYRGADPDLAALAAGGVFYRRLAQMLAAYGLERPPAETQCEFARRASVFLAGRGSSTEAVATVPTSVVDAFYRVRFGHHELDPVALRQLDTRLDALETALRSTRA
jgi:transglutaminase-like putative cysteine protease